MNIPNNFQHGRFKLESYFLILKENDDGFCTVVINEYYLQTAKLDVYKENVENITEYIENELQKGNSIPILYNGQIYDLRIEDKTWVYMERKSK